MNRDDLRAGISAGILAATATSGALVAIGSRGSTAARPFNTIAAHALGAHAVGVYGFVSSVTITGIALHLLLTIVAGLAVAFMVRKGSAPPWIAASAVTILSALVSIGIARRGGSSLAGLLTIGDLILFYVTLGVSLMVGIRLAFFAGPTDRSRRIDTM